MNGFYKINQGCGGNNMFKQTLRLVSIAMLSAVITVSPVIAQNAENELANTELADDATVILNFQDADIRGLINSISKLTGRNFIIDPRVRGNFTLVSGTPLDADQIYEVFLSVLDVHNLSAVPSGDVIKIVPSNVVRQQPTPTISSIDGLNRDEIVTYIYAVKNGSVQTILPIVQPLLPPTSYISAHAPSNSLIISGTAANIDRVLGIIERVDQPDTRSDINIVYLNNTKASKIAGVLSQIVANIQAQAAAEGRPAATTGVSIQPDDAINAIVIQAPEAIYLRAKEVIDKLDVQRDGLDSDIYVVYTKHAKASRIADILNNLESANTQQQNAEGQIPGQTVTTSIQSDDSINAVIIRAAYDRYLVMKSIIDQIDIPKPENAGNVHVAYLKYANAKDLAEVLNNIISEEQSDAGEDGAAGTSAVTVSVEADENTNALIVRSEDTDFAEIKSIIDQLDIRRSQVFVEAIVAEVSEDYSQALGIQWSGVFNDQLSQGTIRSNQNFGGTADLTSGSGTGGTGLNLGFLSGNVIINGTQVVPEFEAVLNAIRSDTNSNILSTPTVLTLENEEAELVVGQEVPFITSRTTSTNTTTDNTGATDGLVQNQNVERKDIGVKLKIKPQINQGDVIRLELEQEVSNIFEGTLQTGAVDIITDTRNIKTVVEVDDGQIVVLGGLTQEDFNDTIQRVPLASRIPVVGALFRSKSKQAVRRNLMVFLRPKIVDSHADIAETTQQKYLQLQEEELLSLPDTRLLIRDTEPPVLPDIDWEKEKERSR